MKRLELTGKRIGSITVIDSAGVNKDGRTLWKCRCDCGNEYITTSGILQTAKTCKRCVGLQDIKGKRFGRLVALEHKYDEKSRHCWTCICDCGNEVIYTQQSLIRGKATTCQRCPTNNFVVFCGFAVGHTAAGETFLFDLDRWNDVVGRTWYKTNKGYIVSGKGAKRVLLHRMMMNASETVRVDHINRNKTDCRSENLRFATNSLNCANSSTYTNNLSSGHKNVYAVDGRYRVAIRKDNHLLHYGYYDDLDDAIMVANTKRRELFGEFAFFDDAYKKPESETGLLSSEQITDSIPLEVTTYQPRDSTISAYSVR